MIFKKLFFFCFIFFLSVSDVSAGVVINEVFPNPSGDSSEPTEFIELYTNVDLNLENYTISDLTKTYTITSVVLSAGQYIVFTRAQTGLQLNNDVETVTLKDSEGNQIDSVSYGHTIEDKSWSRIPNGTGNFENNTDPTPGSLNATPPTPTPGPTSTPTTAPTSQATQSPTPTKETTPTETKAPTPTSRESITEPDVVLGLRNDIATPTPTESENKDDEEKSSKKIPFIAIGFVTVGAGLMSVATLPMIKKKRMTNK